MTFVVAQTALLPAPAHAQLQLGTAVMDPAAVSAAENEPFTPSTPTIEPVTAQAAGPPPTPRHTEIKAMVKGFVTDFKHLSARENALWAGAGGGLALAVHPVGDLQSWPTTDGLQP